MTCRPFQVGDVRAIVCTTRRKPRLCACGRAAPYLCDESSRARARAKTCDQPVCERCVVSLGDNRHRCPACELRATSSSASPPPVVREPKAAREPGREQVGLFGGVTWRSPTNSAPPAACRPVDGDERGAVCIPEVDEIAEARTQLVQAVVSLWRAQAPDGGTRPAGAPALQRFESSGPPSSRWVICPDRITGSLDATVVAPEAWRAPALRMVADERVSVGLYEVLSSGSWALRGRMGLDGRAA